MGPACMERRSLSGKCCLPHNHTLLFSNTSFTASQVTGTLWCSRSCSPGSQRGRGLHTGLRHFFAGRPCASRGSVPNLAWARSSALLLYSSFLKPRLERSRSVLLRRCRKLERPRPDPPGEELKLRTQLHWSMHRRSMRAHESNYFSAAGRLSILLEMA